MKRILILTSLIITAAALIYSAVCSAEETKPIKLPQPETKGGMPLMQAMSERKTSRSFSRKELPPQVMSDLLWAARGINRKDSGLLTVPTTRSAQEMDVYVATAEGLYLYDAKANILLPILKEDIRAATGTQPFVKDAPVNLIFVADLSKMAGMPPEAIDFYTATDTGFISQNVYLFCASAGLATVVRGWVDKPALAKAMKLRPDQRVILTQTVGYPG